jgi:hypothetical protein
MQEIYRPGSISFSARKSFRSIDMASLGHQFLKMKIFAGNPAPSASDHQG